MSKQQTKAMARLRKNLAIAGFTMALFANAVAVYAAMGTAYLMAGTASNTAPQQLSFGPEFFIFFIFGLIFLGAAIYSGYKLTGLLGFGHAVSTKR